MLIFKAPSMFQQSINYSEEGMKGYISSLKKLYEINESFPEIFENILKEYFKRQVAAFFDKL